MGHLHHIYLYCRFSSTRNGTEWTFKTSAVAYPTNLSLKSTGTLLNFTIIFILGLFLGIFPSLFTKDQSLIEILRHAWKGLLVLGILLFIATFCQSKQKFKTYFIVNLIYFVTFVGVLLWARATFEEIRLVQIINIQFISVLPAAVYYLFKAKIHATLPSKRYLSMLFYILGSMPQELIFLSMLFHKADIIMIAFFLDPVAVALYHFATKIMNYAETTSPSSTFSQVIYPRITESFRSGYQDQLKKEYAMSVIRSC